MFVQDDTAENGGGAQPRPLTTLLGCILGLGFQACPPPLSLSLFCTPPALKSMKGSLAE